MLHMRGMALPLVLWTVAALSLMLSGLVRVVRTEVQVASAQLAQVQAEMLARGVVAYVLEGAKADKAHFARLPLAGQLSVQDKQVSFNVVNAAGLIDVRYAEPRLLGLVLQRELAWDQGQIQRVIDLREKTAKEAYSSLSEARRLLSIEQSDWAHLEGHLTVESGASGINVVSAPRSLLEMMVPDNIRAVDAFDRSRYQLVGIPDLTLINSPFHQLNTISAFRVDVQVTFLDGAKWARRYWVRLGYRGGDAWRIVDQQPLPTS